MFIVGKKKKLPCAFCDYFSLVLDQIFAYCSAIQLLYKLPSKVGKNVQTWSEIRHLNQSNQLPDKASKQPVLKQSVDTELILNYFYDYSAFFAWKMTQMFAGSSFSNVIMFFVCSVIVSWMFLEIVCFVRPTILFQSDTLISEIVTGIFHYFLAFYR